MKKIINILSFALLLGGCSGFLEEYSQDLQKYKVMKIWMKSCWARDICLMPV